MFKFLRMAALFIFLGVLVLGTIALDPNVPLLSSYRGFSAGNNSLEGKLLGETIERSERLYREKEASLRRRDAKKRLAKEVVARQRSLSEAMEEFRTLDQQWPLLSVAAKKTQEERGLSEEEWYGRNVLLYVRVVLFDRPDEAALTCDRLMKELEEILAERKERSAALVEKLTEQNR